MHPRRKTLKNTMYKPQTYDCTLLAVIMAGMPILVFLSTLLAPWPTPSGIYAGIGVASLLPFVLLEAAIVGLITTVLVSIACIKMKLSLLATIAIILVSLHLCGIAMAVAFLIVLG